MTGRILSELRRVAGGFHFVDAVVAENGGVVHFPDSGHVSVLAPPVPKPFIALLEQLGIPFQLGQSLTDADANDAVRLLAGIRELELPLVLIFNRGRVMVLSQGVSKATGLQIALDMLRVSPRNTLAVGDGENDHELLRLAEVGAAVEWGSAALQAAADVVISGSGPADVSRFVRRAVKHQATACALASSAVACSSATLRTVASFLSPSAAATCSSRGTPSLESRGWRACCASSSSSMATACA